ncbi:MAG: twin-arginine translocase subunit TatC [Candidatus Bathyarchaeia archaeon]
MSKDTEKSPKNKEMTFWEHTAELANRLKIVLYTLIASTIIMMILPANPSVFTDPFQSYSPLVSVILRTIKAQVLPENVELIGLEITNPIELYVVASFFFGLAVTAPVFAYQIFRFVDPALYPHERREIYPLLGAFLLLFLSGLIFGYVVLVPYAISAVLPFFTAVGAKPVISVNDFYYTVFFLTLLTGFTFTFPVFLVLLVKYGIMGTKVLTKNRKYLYFAVLILVFVITPGEGGLANLMLFIPLIILLEGGIFFARRYEKKGEIHRLPWFTEETKCKFCGKAMPSNVTFCPNCGKSGK